MTEYKVLHEAKNYIQAFLGRASGLYHAPLIEETPDSIDSFELPLVLTELKQSQYTGGNDQWEAVLAVVSTFFVDSLGSPSLSMRQTLATEIFDQVMAWVLNEDNYIKIELPDGSLVSTGSLTLARSPIELVIQRAYPQAFKSNGLGVFEYPKGVSRPWYGFELSYTINARWPINC